MAKEELMGAITFEEGAKSAKHQTIVDSKHLAALELMTTIADRERKGKLRSRTREPTTSNSINSVTRLYAGQTSIQCLIGTNRERGM